MNKETSIAMCAIGVIAIMLVIIFATVLIYEKIHKPLRLKNL